MSVVIHAYHGANVTVIDGAKALEDMQDQLEGISQAVDDLADAVADGIEMLATGIGGHNDTMAELISALNDHETGASITSDGPVEITKKTVTVVRELDEDELYESHEPSMEEIIAGALAEFIKHKSSGDEDADTASHD